MKNTKYLMIIGGGILQVPLIQTASAMSVKTIVTDYDPNAYGLKIADYPTLMSTRDVDGTVRIAKEISKKIPIHGVMTVGTDASKTVAAVANALGLPGIKFEDAECATNKIKMRTRFKQFQVPCPDFAGVWTYKEALDAFDKLSQPLVVKPADNMGARGVRRIDSKEELSAAFESAKANSPSGEVIIEEYMEGDELSIDSLVCDGQVYICGIADRIIERAPFFIETGHVMPSQKSKEILDEAVEVLKKGIKALGITIGAAKGDIKVTPQGVKIVEMAARLSGGFMSTYTFPYSSGVNLMQAGIKIMLGEKPTSDELTPKWSKVAVEKALIPEPGIIKEIKGLEEAEQIHGVRNIFITKEIGDEVVKPVNNVQKAGHIIAVAETHQKAFDIIDRTLKTIQFVIEPKRELTLEEVKKKALEKFNKTCFVCRDCNGAECRGKVPGIGSAGTGLSFKNNIHSIRKYQMIPSYVHPVKTVSMEASFFGLRLDAPILIAPITGVKTNMGGGMSEEDFAYQTVLGGKLSGLVSMLGDGATPDRYKIGNEAIAKSGGHGIFIMKPRKEEEEIIKRIRKAEESGAPAVGMDIDAAAFITMRMKNQQVEPKSPAELKKIISSTHLPFIVKGIFSVEDALRAVEAGAAAIYVSNHGGRVMDYMPGALDVLPKIREKVGKEVKIIVDGGFREGIDIYKGLALGADFVAIGRPAAIAVIGGGAQGLELQTREWKLELSQAMLLTGCEKVTDISPKSLYLA